MKPSVQISCLLLAAAVASLACFCSAQETTTSTAAPPKVVVNTDADMAQFNGTYSFEKDDGNFESLLKQTGTNFFVRKIVIYLTPVINFNVTPDGVFSLRTTTTFKNSYIEFKLGQEFEENRMDGVTVKTSISRDGNKLVQVQKTDPPVEISREFTGNKLFITSKCNGVTNVRQYKKI